jgi:hypothetical protein
VGEGAAAIQTVDLAVTVDDHFDLGVGFSDDHVLHFVVISALICLFLNIDQLLFYLI